MGRHAIGPVRPALTQGLLCCLSECASKASGPALIFLNGKLLAWPVINRIKNIDASIFLIFY